MLPEGEPCRGYSNIILSAKDRVCKQVIDTAYTDCDSCTISATQALGANTSRSLCRASHQESLRWLSMKVGFALARLHGLSFSSESNGEDIKSDDSSYELLNDQTWTAIFSWLSTADLARSRVRHACLLWYVLLQESLHICTFAGGMLGVEGSYRLSRGEKQCMLC